MECPCCGFRDDIEYNPSRKIQELRNKRSKYTRKLLRRVTNLIQTNIPSENKLLKEYYFYQGISYINDEEIDWSINRYMEGNQYLQAKGFKYLSAIIINRDKNKNVVSKNELLMRGKPPSIKEIKNA